MSNHYIDAIQPSFVFHSTRRIADVALLEPCMRQKVEAILVDAEALGFKLIVFETYRSRERQQQLFEQGASKLRAVGVHHFGLACDLVKDVGGDPSWKGDFSFLGDLGRRHNLIWGGDWGSPERKHTFIDAVHLQRCSLTQQPVLFSGAWYPDESYSPYGSMATAKRRVAAKASAKAAKARG
jgi:hypothetical protein